MRISPQSLLWNGILHTECEILGTGVVIVFEINYRSLQNANGIEIPVTDGEDIGIIEARFTLVLSLLNREDILLDAIADIAGWKSAAVLRQYFNRKTGISMRDYRKKHKRTKQ